MQLLRQAHTNWMHRTRYCVIYWFVHQSAFNNDASERSNNTQQVCLVSNIQDIISILLYNKQLMHRDLFREISLYYNFFSSSLS